ncbi:class I SAM-dependent methyltransferase [Candidatus Chloroploca sp. Khr17]|uniref:class I SAM-dependent methyltransferase n=1 Tax=Candidatus Chloroploca sp. Khr17 TaxID=2496869 RepID=UPI00101C39BE|nr:class I SAM-dependent methyltransferase [Candidatus Chloroploca sp. Khr17]
MPTMYEIYAQYAPEYDALVTHEDYQGQLAQTLQRLYDVTNKDVAEFGVGTGRVTAMLVEQARHITCFDRSPHMLAYAQQKLQAYADKLAFVQRDNLELNQVECQVDCVIEGWSFGHTVLDHPETMDDVIDHLVAGCISLARPGGAVILIETMGTMVDAPAPPLAELAHFYARLRDQHGFAEHVIRTDYAFADAEEAAKIMGFFFGEAMGEHIRTTRQAIIKEYTGIWIKTIT